MKGTIWIDSMKDLIKTIDLGKDIYVGSLKDLPETNRRVSNRVGGREKENWFFKYFKREDDKDNMNILVYEKKEDGELKPRVIIEARLEIISNRETVSLNNQSLCYKNMIPYVKYGFILANRGHYPLPTRIFEYGRDFDFIMSFQNNTLHEDEKMALEMMLKKEIKNSRKKEEEIFADKDIKLKTYLPGKDKELELI